MSDATTDHCGGGQVACLVTPVLHLPALLGMVAGSQEARRGGWQVNNKRVRRLRRDEGLWVAQRRKKNRLTGIGVAVGAMSPIRPNVI